MTAPAQCIGSLAAAQPGGRKERAGWVLALTILASSLDFIDGSVLNVGLPAIGRSFPGQGENLQWVVNAYMTPLSALLLFGGALGDRFGRPRLLALGVLLFALASVGCAAAPSLAWLIAARAAQGLAAAMVMPSSLAMLGDTFEGKARNRAIGLWAATAALAAALGPLLGGLLTDRVGWRAIFLINPPLAALALIIAIPEVRACRVKADGAPLDIVGAVLVTTAIAALTWALTSVSAHRGWSLPTLAALAAGLAAAAGFVRTEGRLGDRAMTPPALFGSRPLVALNLLTLVIYGVLAGLLLLLPYWLITQGGYSATEAGAALLPFPLVVAVLSPLVGDLAGRIGQLAPLVAGAALACLGLLLALRLAPGASYAASVLPCVLAVGVGMACEAGPLTTAVLGAVDNAHTGAASGLNSALAQLGGVLVIALVGATLSLKGAAFDHAFRLAAVVGASAALAAGLATAVLYRPPNPLPDRSGAARRQKG